MRHILIGLLAMLLTNYGYAQQVPVKNNLKSLFEEKDPSKLRSALNSYMESKVEGEFTLAVNYYTYKNHTKTADSLKEIALVRFPQGDFAYADAVNKFQSQASYKDKISYHEKVIKHFKNRDFSSFNGMLVLEAVENRDCTLATSTFSKIEDTSYIHYFIPTLCEKLMLTKETNGECLNAFLQSLIDRYKNMLRGSMVSEKAPNITLKDINGTQISLEALKGKIVILDFWATWCKPCLQSFPGMQAAVNRYENDPNIVFLFINTAERADDPTPAVKKIIEDNRYTFRVLMDKKDKTNQGFPAADSFEVAALPTKYVIDKDGQIRFKLLGTNGGSQFIQEEIKMMIDAIN